MQRKREKTPVQGFPAGRLRLAALLVVCAFPFLCAGEGGVRYPAAGPRVVPARQGTVQIQGVLISYPQNSAKTRLSDVGSSTYRPGSWVRIMVQFSTQLDWIDEVRFDCYVLLRDGNRDTMLTGSVTCAYVERGDGHLTCLFVPPKVMERYGRVRAVGVECYYQNSMTSDYSAPRTTQKWWQGQTGVPGTMVTWFYTPFLRDGVEMYEHIKTGGQGF